MNILPAIEDAQIHTVTFRGGVAVGGGGGIVRG
jgi:hypothetical protein